MLGLLRRDPAVRAMPKWLVVAPLTATALEGARSLLVAIGLRSGSAWPAGGYGDLLLLSLTVWLPVALFLALGGVRQRCSHFDTVLPTPASRLWIAHLIAMILSAWAVLLSAAAVPVLRERWVVRLVAGAPVPEVTSLWVVLAAGAGVVLACALLQAWRTPLYRIPYSRGYAVWTLCVLAAMLAAVMALTVVHPLWLFVPMLASLVIALPGVRSLPGGFTLVPRTAQLRRRQAASPDDAPLASREHRAGRWFRDWTVFLILSRGIAPGQLWRVPVTLWLGMPVCFGWGVLLSGVLLGDAQVWIGIILLTPYILFAFLLAPLTQLSLLDPLPIPRRKLFAHIVLPPLVVLTAGYAAGRLGPIVWGGGRELPASPGFKLVFLAVILAFFLATTILLRTYRVSIRHGVRLGVFYGLLAVLLALSFVEFASAIAGWFDPRAAVERINDVAGQIGDFLPGGQLALWLICLLVLTGGYELTLGQFRRIEVPLPRTEKEA